MEIFLKERVQQKVKVFSSTNRFIISYFKNIVYLQKKRLRKRNRPRYKNQKQ